MEFTILVIVSGLSIGLIRVAYSKKGVNTKKNKKITVLNLSNIAIKHKKYQIAINERTKGMF